MQQINIQKLLFIDVETVSGKQHFNELNEAMQELWMHKHRFIPQAAELSADESYEKHAAIYAEFGKIVCISCGFLDKNTLRLKSFYGNNETDILTDFASMLNIGNYTLCGHNIKEFDIPYLCRRMLINQIPLPDTLNIGGKKPWEVEMVDTLQLWKFGDYKAYTSLKLLTEIFNISTPKDDIDGSMVGKVFWEEKNIERIKTYCQKDVVSVVRLIQRWQNLPLIEDKDTILLNK